MTTKIIVTISTKSSLFKNNTDDHGDGVDQSHHNDEDAHDGDDGDADDDDDDDDASDIDVAVVNDNFNQ